MIRFVGHFKSLMRQWQLAEPSNRHTLLRTLHSSQACGPQAAYQPGRGTIEQKFSLTQIIEKSLEFNTPVHLVFIDFTKAFDSIELHKLWDILDRSPINKHYINLLKAVYDGSQAIIRTDIGTSRLVDIKKGVKQGDMLSAVLFCVALASVLFQTETSCHSGFSVGGVIISNLGYADDIALTNSCPMKLQEFINEFSKNAQEIGLQINFSKTVSMSTEKAQSPLHISINGHEIKQVTEFVYLGHKLSALNDQTIAVKHRVGLAWATFGKHASILKSNRIPLHIKTKIYNIYILPILLYGMECIAWTKNLLQIVEVFQNNIMRLMTGHRLIERVSIAMLRDLTCLGPLICKIKSKSLK